MVSTDTESKNPSVVNNNNAIGTERASVNDIAHHHLILDTTLPVLDAWGMLYFSKF